MRRTTVTVGRLMQKSAADDEVRIRAKSKKVKKVAKAKEVEASSGANPQNVYKPKKVVTKKPKKIKS